MIWRQEKNAAQQDVCSGSGSHMYGASIEFERSPGRNRHGPVIFKDTAAVIDSTIDPDIDAGTAVLSL